MLDINKYGIKNDHTPCAQDYLTCLMTKNTKYGFASKLTVKLETATIYADIQGPIRMTSYGGSLYFLAMTDTQQRHVSVKPLKIETL